MYGAGMRVYLRPSAEAIALEPPLVTEQRVRWFVRWPADIAEGFGGDLASRLGIDPSELSFGELVVEDHDSWFSNLDEADALWIEGTVSSWATHPLTPVGSYVLVELRDVSMAPYIA